MILYSLQDEKPGGSEDDTIITFIGNKFFKIRKSVIFIKN